jgi:hypothetical protein
MSYIVNYQSKDDDVFIYGNEFSVWPVVQGQCAIARNENLLLERTVAYNDVIIPYKIDLSGIEGPCRNVAYFYCGSCLQIHPQWPYCNNFWAYGFAAGTQGIGDECSVPLFDNIPSDLEPINTINPIEKDELYNYVNAKYWNDVNFWHTGTFNSAILLKAETNDETYLLALGHPVTTSPCDYDFNHCFFDGETNTVECRYFTCPCREWGLELTGQRPGGLQCNNCCKKPYQVFTSGVNNYSSGERPDTVDWGYRVYVMKKFAPDGSEQQPLPDSIKKYKVLVGQTRNSWPIFGIDSSYRFIFAGHTTIKNTVLRKRTDGKFRLSNETTYKMQIPNINLRFDGGEGDDGNYPSFTIDEYGETIFISWNASTSWADYITKNDHDLYNKPLTENVETPCTSDNIFIKTDSTLKFNTYCYPALFHPELVIPQYPTNDINIYTTVQTDGGITHKHITALNDALEELGKPKILWYTFPEFFVPDTNSFPDNISETQQKYPLFESPYLSRESKNSFFPNANLIAFSEKKMLQAAELNELQEKFYKNQSLLVKYYNNWLTKQNIESKVTDLIGFSDKINLEILSEYANGINYNKAKTMSCSRAIPIQNNSIEIGSRNENGIAQIRLNPCDIMLYSNASVRVDPSNYREFPQKLFKGVDFLNITSTVIGELNLSEIKENSIHAITLLVDTNNIINCNQYPELKDNTVQETNSIIPCGASRNYISATTIIQQNIELDGELFNAIVLDKSENLTIEKITPFNGIAFPDQVSYLLGYIKKENNGINLYYANGIKMFSR